MPAKYVLQKAAGGKFRFTLHSTSGAVVVTSATYGTKAAAKTAIKTLQRNVNADVEDQTVTAQPVRGAAPRRTPVSGTGGGVAAKVASSVRGAARTAADAAGSVTAGGTGTGTARRTTRRATADADATTATGAPRRRTAATPGDPADVPAQA
ncbi:MAG: YegP family protein, partial [Actinomycetota bacterium]|nr:YegP family protein [Actinomycetota bacterium]